MKQITLENIELTETSKSPILEELDRILTSDLFSRSPVLSNFLKFIVLETLDNETDGLKEYTIAVSALGKSPEFNPQTDAIVRIHAGRLRRLLGEYYLGAGIDDPLRIEVIKGSYVPVFRSNKIDTPTLSVAEKSEPKHLYSRSKLTLAVLPFRNLCSNNEYQFFADGFGEELTRLFSCFQDIAVIAHHSALKYAIYPDDVRQIGADLGVHYLINGSVKRSPKEIRVNVGLIETLNGLQVWSETYKYELNIDNLSSIQDEIIENVSSSLGGYYGFIISEGFKKNRKPTPSLSSFDAALWNYYLHINFSMESFNQTLDALKLALKQDPDDATCMAMLSELYLDSHIFGFHVVDDPVTEGYQLAKNALKVDPKCQHAWQQYAWANIFLKRKKVALESMNRCLELNPYSVSTTGAVGFAMACVGEYKRANELLTESLQLNPHCPWWFYLGFFLCHFHQSDFVKSLEYANKIEASDVFLVPLIKAVSKVELGLYEEAWEDAEALTQNYPEVAANLDLHLNSFLLDTGIVDNLLFGYKKVLATTH